MRTAFVEALVEVARTDPRVWLLTGDLGFSVLEPFAERFPERYVNVGVAEQNMVGIASGLAMAGKVVFTYSIANFATLRCLEQIRNDACYHDLPVKVVAVGAGLTYGSLGYTHHGLEDIPIMRALPRLAVIAPGDPVEAALAVRELVRWPGPAYLRLGKAGEPVVHRDGLAELPASKLILVREGRGPAILATGSMLPTAVDAANQLAGLGVDTAVYSVPWLKPFDAAAVATLARKHSLIHTLEEGQRSGGLGGLVAETLAELPAPRARLVRGGLDDLCLHEVVSQKAGREANGLGVEAIVEALRKGS